MSASWLAVWAGLPFACFLVATPVPNSSRWTPATAEAASGSPSTKRSKRAIHTSLVLVKGLGRSVRAWHAGLAASSRVASSSTRVAGFMVREGV